MALCKKRYCYYTLSITLLHFCYQPTSHVWTILQKQTNKPHKGACPGRDPVKRFTLQPPNVQTKTTEIQVYKCLFLMKTMFSPTNTYTKNNSPHCWTAVSQRV